MRLRQSLGVVTDHQSPVTTPSPVGPLWWCPACGQWVVDLGSFGRPMPNPATLACVPDSPATRPLMMEMLAIRFDPLNSFHSRSKLATIFTCQEATGRQVAIRLPRGYPRAHSSAPGGTSRAAGCRAAVQRHDLATVHDSRVGTLPRRMGRPAQVAQRSGGLARFRSPVHPRPQPLRRHQPAPGKQARDKGHLGANRRAINSRLQATAGIARRSKRQSGLLFSHMGQRRPTVEASFASRGQGNDRCHLLTCLRPRLSPLGAPCAVDPLRPNGEPYRRFRLEMVQRPSYLLGTADRAEQRVPASSSSSARTPA
jgi:hypothetical protein